MLSPGPSPDKQASRRGRRPGAGYGFSRGRGGPMFWADQIGSDKVHAAMQRLNPLGRDRLAPAPLLSCPVAQDKKFADA